MPPTPPLAGDKPQRYISLIQFSAVVATRMAVGVAGRCRNPSRIGVRDMCSYQSLMPVGAGTPRYENWGCWLVEVSWVSLVPPLDSGPVSGYGACFRANRSSRLAPAHQGMKMRPGSRKCLGVVGATLPLWIPAFAGMTNSVAGTIHPGSESGTCFRTNRPCRLVPAH